MCERISRAAVWGLLGCVFLAGGCVDAVAEGITAGVRDGLEAIVEDFIAGVTGG